MTMPTPGHPYPSAPQPTPTSTPAAKSPWYLKRRLLLPATAVVFFAIGAGGQSKPAATGATAKPAATVTVSAPAVAVTVTQTAQAPAAPPAAPAQPAGDTIKGDGTYEVGPDMKPGKYKTAGPNDSGLNMCYWARLKGDNSIIDNAILQGQGVVTVKEGELFESKSCQDWVKVG